jgi:hypothetical protein
MQLVFLDEAGYTPDWESGIQQQPIYALSAVCLPTDRIKNAYDTIRSTIDRLRLKAQPARLGCGHEIKAKDIAVGSGWWKHHNDERNAIRDVMLSAPCQFGGCAILAVIDKRAHKEKYAYPGNPYSLALQFVFERLGQHLLEIDEYAYAVYDQNTRLQDEVLEQSSELITDGSRGFGYSDYYRQYYAFSIALDHVIELGVGVSEHSLGLQIADYFATFAYHYHRDGKPEPCGWWDTLCASLRTQNGTFEGYGLKRFP